MVVLLCRKNRTILQAITEASTVKLGMSHVSHSIQIRLQKACSAVEFRLQDGTLHKS